MTQPKSIHIIPQQFDLIRPTVNASKFWFYDEFLADKIGSRSCHCEPWMAPASAAWRNPVFEPGRVKQKNIRVKGMHSRQPIVYIMANKRNGTLYTGVTSDLIRRVYQHKHEEMPVFTKHYQCKRLVYYEQHEDMYSAISREKQIKGGSRKKKLALIESMNPSWQDLYETLL